jgi:hypothetical protein
MPKRNIHTDDTIYNDTIDKQKTLILELLNKIDNKDKIQDQRKKMKKHFPATLKPKIFDGKLKFPQLDKNEKIIYPILDHNCKDGRSYTLSDKEIDEHLDYIVEQLNIYMNSICYGTEVFFSLFRKISIRVIDVTSESKYNNKYYATYLVNVKPKFVSFVCKKEKLCICNSYVIAFANVDGDTILNMFFDYNPNYTELTFINEFNDDPNKFLHDTDMKNIISNYEFSSPNTLDINRFMPKININGTYYQTKAFITNTSVTSGDETLVVEKNELLKNKDNEIRKHYLG